MSQTLADLLPKRAQTAAKQASACPVCGLVLTGRTKAASARHVNACLDFHAGPAPAPTTSTVTNSSKVCPACDEPLGKMPLDRHMLQCSFGAASTPGKKRPFQALTPSASSSSSSHRKHDPVIITEPSLVDEASVKEKWQSMFSRSRATPKATKKTATVMTAHSTPFNRATSSTVTVAANKKIKMNPVVSRVVATVPPMNNTTSHHEPVRLPSNGRTSCPSFKHIAHTRMMVDAFQYAPVKNGAFYFLTHFHSDHYIGIHKNWNVGDIYCTEATAKLLKSEFNPAATVQVVPMYTRVKIDDVYITLVDANHCPGAVILFIEVNTLQGIQLVIHTGDFRYHPIVRTNTLALPHLEKLLSRVDMRPVVYLDSTYGKPQYTFPEQRVILEYVVNIVNSILMKERGSGDTDVKQTGLAALLNGYSSTRKPKTLFMVGTYFIGKEKILLALIQYCKLKIHCHQRKLRAYTHMDILNLPNALIDNDQNKLKRKASTHVKWSRAWDIKAKSTRSINSYFDKNAQVALPLQMADVFTTDMNAARVHVKGLGDVSQVNLKKQLDDKNSGLTTYMKQHGFNSICAFRPTGWAGKIGVTKKMVGTTNVVVHAVPYSEHSSYTELCAFLEWTRPKQILDTVNPRDEAMACDFARFLQH